MIKTVVGRVGPQIAIFETGCWEKLEELLLSRKVKKALIVHGKISWQKFASKIPEFSEVEVKIFEYCGESTYAETERLNEAAAEFGAQALIAVGGGKITDVTKMAASISEPQRVLAVLPTLAGTCAAWASVAVMYDENHVMLNFPYLTKTNDILLVDPEIILDSPKEMLVAGIGDTLAKWYECNAVIPYLEETTTAIDIAFNQAKMCYDALLKYSKGAFFAIEKQVMNKDFRRVIETIIMTAGTVGGFGDAYARSSGAHSIHDALTILPEAHNILHGTKVAYGILIQLILEEKYDDILELLPLYREINLPTNLADINLSNVEPERLMKVSERATLPTESIHLLNRTVTAQDVYDAIFELEEFVANN